jgi:hypothetical protein
MTTALRVGVVCLAVAAWSLTVAAPVVGSAPPAVCQLQARIEANEGFWAAKRTETVMRSVSGFIVCAGFVNGREVLAQPVPFAQVFTNAPGGNCAHGTGTGTWEFVLPMADGTSLPVSGSQEGGWASPSYWATGTFNGQAVRGGGVVRTDPDYSGENCVTEPLRHWFDIGQLLVGP